MDLKDIGGRMGGRGLDCCDSGQVQVACFFEHDDESL